MGILQKRHVLPLLGWYAVGAGWACRKWTCVHHLIASVFYSRDVYGNRQLLKLHSKLQ
jgi:hypothetical protein